MAGGGGGEAGVTEAGARPGASKLPWAEIDTVLLDMDGTLIDLRFDNHLWNVVVVRRFARREGIDEAQAADRLYRDMLGRKASLDFYDLDYWARQTRLDIDAIHEELKALIRYRPGAWNFAAAVRRSGRRLLLATNAHPRSVAVKHRAIGLLGAVDGCYSAHELGAPKEDDGYWRGLAQRLGASYNPARTLLVDDNDVVLAAAQRAGVRHLLCVAQPDSTGAPRHDLPFRAIGDFAEILPVRAHAPSADAGGVDRPR